MSKIFEFIHLPHRFRWGGMGGDDCMTFPATWVLFAMGVDPAQHLRGTYRTRHDAHEIILRFGGHKAFMEHHLLPIGCSAVLGDAAARDGDIGLVSMQSVDESGAAYMATIGAICFGPNWVTTGPNGLIGKRATRIAAWRLPALA